MTDPSNNIGNPNLGAYTGLPYTNTLAEQYSTNLNTATNSSGIPTYTSLSTPSVSVPPPYIPSTTYTPYTLPPYTSSIDTSYKSPLPYTSSIDTTYQLPLSQGASYSSPTTQLSQETLQNLNQQMKSIDPVSSNIYGSQNINPLIGSNLSNFSLEKSPTRGSNSATALQKKQRIEIKAHLGYLVHLKDDLIAKQQEYQTDVSGLMTSMKKDMETHFQKALQEGQVAPQQDTNSSQLQRKIDELSVKLVESRQSTDLFEIKIKHLEEALDDANQRKIQFQSLVQDIEPINGIQQNLENERLNVAQKQQEITNLQLELAAVKNENLEYNKLIKDIRDKNDQDLGQKQTEIHQLKCELAAAINEIQEREELEKVKKGRLHSNQKPVDEQAEVSEQGVSYKAQFEELQKNSQLEKETIEQQLKEKQNLIEQQIAEIINLTNQLAIATASKSKGEEGQDVDLIVGTQNPERSENEVQSGKQDDQEETFEYFGAQNRQTERKEEDKQGFFDKANDLRKELEEESTRSLQLLTNERNAANKQVQELSEKYLETEKHNNELKAKYEAKEKELTQQLQKANEELLKLEEQRKAQVAEIEKRENAKLVDLQAQIQGEVSKREEQERLKTELQNQLTEELNKVQEQLGQLNKAQRQLEEERNSHAQSGGDLNEQLKRAFTEKDEAKRNLEAAIANSQELTNQLQKEKEGRNSDNLANFEKVEKVQNELEKSRQSEGSLKEQLRASEERIQQISSELEKKHFEETNSKADLSSQLQQLKDQLAHSNQSSDSEIIALRSRLEAVQSQDKNLHEELGNLKNQNTALSQEKEQQNQRLSDEIEAKNRLAVQISEITEAKNQLEGKLHDSKALSDQLSEKQSQVENKLSEEIATNTRLSGQISILQHELSGLEEKLQGERKKVDDILSQTNSSSSDLIAQNEQKVREQERIHKEEINALNQQILKVNDNLRDQVAAAQHAGEEKAKELKKALTHELEEAKVAAQKEAASLQAQISQIEGKLNQEREQHKTKIAELGEQQKEQLSSVESGKEQEQKLQQELAQAKNQAKKATEQLSALQTEKDAQIHSLNDKLSKLEKDLSSVNQKSEHSSKQQDSSISAIQEENKKKIAEIEEASQKREQQSVNQLKQITSEVEKQKSLAEILSKEKNYLASENAVLVKSHKEKEQLLQKEIGQLKGKFESDALQSKQEIQSLEKRIKELKASFATAAAHVAHENNSGESSNVVNSGNAAVSREEYNALNIEFKDLLEVNKENLQKIQEERRLYGILQEDCNRFEQQLTQLKNEKGSKISDKKPAGEATENSGNSGQSSSINASKKRENKALQGAEERKTKDLEASLFSLKEENAIIRDQLKEKYEKEISSLKAILKEQDSKIWELTKAEEELKELKDKQEEEEWSKALKNNSLNSATAKKANENPTKKTGLEKEKEDLLKVLEKKNEELRKLKKTLNQTTSSLQKLEKLQQQQATPTAPVEAKPESLTTLNTEENEVVKKGKKKSEYKTDDALQQILKLSEIIYLLNDE